MYRLLSSRAVAQRTVKSHRSLLLWLLAVLCVVRLRMCVVAVLVHENVLDSVAWRGVVVREAVDLCGVHFPGARRWVRCDQPPHPHLFAGRRVMLRFGFVVVAVVWVGIFVWLLLLGAASRSTWWCGRHTW